MSSASSTSSSSGSTRLSSSKASSSSSATSGSSSAQFSASSSSVSSASTTTKSSKSKSSRASSRTKDSDDEDDYEGSDAPTSSGESDSDDDDDDDDDSGSGSGNSSSSSSSSTEKSSSVSGTSSSSGSSGSSGSSSSSDSSGSSGSSNSSDSSSAPVKSPGDKKKPGMVSPQRTPNTTVPLKSAMKSSAHKGHQLEEEMSPYDRNQHDTGDGADGLERLIGTGSYGLQDEDTGEDTANRLHNQKRLERENSSSYPLAGTSFKSAIDMSDDEMALASEKVRHRDTKEAAAAAAGVPPTTATNNEGEGALAAVGGLLNAVGGWIGIASEEPRPIKNIVLRDDDVTNHGNTLDTVNMNMLTDKEKERGKAVYDRCTQDVQVNANDSEGLQQQGETNKKKSAKGSRITDDEENNNHHDPYKMTFDRFQLALSFLGFQETFERIRSTFDLANREMINLEIFLKMLVIIQGQENQQELEVIIEKMFHALYAGTCEDDSQRDEFGRKYLLANELRKTLTTIGGIDNVLTVEEADELIRETHPIAIYEIGSAVPSSERIYLEQYRSMLLNHDP